MRDGGLWGMWPLFGLHRAGSAGITSAPRCGDLPVDTDAAAVEFSARLHIRIEIPIKSAL